MADSYCSVAEVRVLCRRTAATAGSTIRCTFSAFGTIRHAIRESNTIGSAEEAPRSLVTWSTCESIMSSRSASQLVSSVDRFSDLAMDRWMSPVLTKRME